MHPLGGSDAPRHRSAFVSYAHDSLAHKYQVLKLAELLVRCGVDVELDQWAARRQDWSSWATGGMTSADFIIVVASPAYGRAGDGLGPAPLNRGVQSEAAVLRDLLHRNREKWLPRLLPVVLPQHEIEEIPTFLQPFTADHYRIEELTEVGIEELLRVITDQPGRVRPPIGPVPTLPQHPRLLPREFPEPAHPVGTSQEPPAVRQPWRALRRPLEVQWLSELTNDQNPQQAHPTLELHLVPVEHQDRLQVRWLRPLANDLAALGRRGSLFSVAEQLQVDSTDQAALAYSFSPREGTAGLAALRNGQRSSWTGLLRDRNGTVLVEDDVMRRLVCALTLLVSLDLPDPVRVSPAVGIEPLGGVRIGPPLDVHSSTARAPGIRPKHIRLPADEALTFADLRGSITDVAEELATRLIATFRRECR